MPPKKTSQKKKSIPTKRRNRLNQSLPNARNGFVLAPSAIGGAIRTMPAQYTYKSSGDARIRVHHRELVSDIAGSVNFATTAYALNPGLSAVFPWLYRQARLYESYRFDNLTVEYIPMKGSDKDGRVSLAVDFDAADAAPASMAQVGNYHLQASDRIWNPLAVVMDRADLDKFGVQRFVRSAAVAGTDIKTYDVGNLYVSTIGCADTSNIGSLYLEFDVWFMTPQVEPDPEADEVVESFYAFKQGAASKSDLFSTDAAVQGNLDVSVSGNTVTFNKAGSYQVILSLYDVSAGLSGTIGSTGSTATIGYGSQATTTTKVHANYAVAATAGQTFVISVGTLTGDPEDNRVWVCPAEVGVTYVPDRALVIQPQSLPSEGRPRSLTEMSSIYNLPLHR